MRDPAGRRPARRILPAAWAARLRSGWNRVSARIFAERSDRAAWHSMARTLAVSLGGGLAAVGAFITLVDPYDVVPFSPPAQRPIMDLNQRWMYPSIVRSGRYDSLVIGTSTIRLLDPQELDRAFGGRFANLAMNSATAWEQLQVAQLFLREKGAPRTLLVGIDLPWCAQNADKETITFRGFPPWMYDDNRWNDILHLFNGKTLEIAFRLVGYWIGVREPRYREDGYEVFVPPESQYDLARVRTHLYPNGQTPLPPVEPPVTLSREQKARLRFPAVEWLSDYLDALANRTRIVIAVMPVHITGQPQAGSEAAAVERTCIERIAAMAHRYNALMVDWRYPSALTRDDTRYWDPLHYRLPVASGIVRTLEAASRGETSKDGSWTVLSRPAP
ncbi:hypothetical protein [Alsobacter sp. R-9]